MKRPKLSIVIPTCNRLKYLKMCLESICKHTKEVDYEIIIVDGGSTDGTREFLLNQSDIRVRAILERKLEGATKSANKGAKEAWGEYVCWLNDDIIVIDRALDKMIDFLEKTEDKRIGIGTFYFTEPPYDVDDFVATYYANFGMMRTSLMKELNYFDESFEAYGSDPDLSLRIWGKGLCVIGCREARLVHIHVNDILRSFNSGLRGKDQELLHKRWSGERIKKLILTIQEDGRWQYLGQHQKVNFHYECAMSYQQQNRFKEAEEEFKKALSIEGLFGKRRFEVLLPLANCYSSQGRFKEAEDRFNEILSIERIADSQRFYFLLGLGGLYTNKGEYTKAEEELKKALSLELFDRNIVASIHYALGSNYERQGRFNEAIEKFNYVVNNESLKFKGGSHFHLGCIYKELGKGKEARQHFEECLKIIPDHRKAKEYLNE